MRCVARKVATIEDRAVARDAAEARRGAVAPSPTERSGEITSG